MTQTIQMLIRKFRAADKKYVRNHSWGFFGIRVYVGSDISRFMPRARLCHAKREQLPKSQHIPITCASYRGAYIRHNPGSICYPKCGKQTPFIPSEVRKNFLEGFSLIFTPLPWLLIMPRGREQKVSDTTELRQSLRIIKDAA